MEVHRRGRRFGEGKSRKFQKERHLQENGRASANRIRKLNRQEEIDGYGEGEP